MKKLNRENIIRMFEGEAGGTGSGGGGGDIGGMASQA